VVGALGRAAAQPRGDVDRGDHRRVLRHRVRAAVHGPCPSRRGGSL